MDENREENPPKKIKISQPKDFIKVIYKNFIVFLPENSVDEIGYIKECLSKSENGKKEITISDDFSSDPNFNAAGIVMLRKLLQKNLDEDKFKSPDLVSALAVSHYLSAKSIAATCGNLMKQNLDKNNCLLYYNTCKKYRLTIESNEIFYWLLINFMCLYKEAELPEFDLIDKLLLVNLLKSKIFVVSNEYKLYKLIKQWMLNDLKKQNKLQLYEDLSEVCFLSTDAGREYQELFDFLRLHCLVAYIEKIEELQQDRILSPDALNKAIFEIQMRLMNIPDSSQLDGQKIFRFARRFNKSNDYEFPNDFYIPGVLLNFKFNSKRLAVERCQINDNLMYHSSLASKMTFTLYASTVRDNTRFNTESAPEFEADLKINKERMIHGWRKPVSFPCILFGEVKILLGHQTIELAE